MSLYYDFTPQGEMILVPEEIRRQAAGLKFLTSERVKSWSEGKYSESGWLISDNVQGPTHYAKSDDLGVGGVLNPVDGKMYDSRAAYERAVRAAGCVIMGDDAPKEMAKPKVKDIDWKPAIAETLKQLSPTKKGKKR
jgi:hypothetical protein